MQKHDFAFQNQEKILVQNVDFIDAIHVPLGNAKLEKYLFDGLAVVAGTYPHIYVRSVDQVFAGEGTRWFWLKVSLWLLRVWPCVFLLVLVYDVGWRRRRQSV